MEVNVVDTVDPGLRTVLRQLISMNQNPIEIPKGANGVERMVQKVIDVAQKPGAISVLRIYSHGNSGMFAVTGGDHDIDPTSIIADWNIAKLEPTLARLSLYFANNGRLEIYGCYVATHLDDKSDVHSFKVHSEGEQLISKLARILGVKVLASGNSAKGLPIAALGFIGTVIQAEPGGAVGCAEAIPIAAIKTR